MNFWHTFHSVFDTNDGSLPEIDIDQLSPAGLASIWMYLRTAAAGYVGDAWFWHNSTEQETPLDAVVNAAQLVATGEASPFHTVLRGIGYFGAAIPDLGVFVFQDSITLDYRMGTDWNAANLTALFELLHQILRIEPNADISLSKTFFSPEWRARFRTAFIVYGHQTEQTGQRPYANRATRRLAIGCRRTSACSPTPLRVNKIGPILNAGCDVIAFPIYRSGAADAHGVGRG